MSGSRNFRKGGGGGPGQSGKKSSDDFLFLFFFKSSAYFTEGGGGGGGFQLVIPYRNPYNLWFSRGGGGPDPLSPPLDPHLCFNQVLA